MRGEGVGEDGGVDGGAVREEPGYEVGVAEGGGADGLGNEVG